MSAKLINCGGCLRDDASKMRAGGGIYWRWSGEAVGKHAEVGLIDSPRRIFEGYLSLKELKRHQAHALSLARR